MPSASLHARGHAGVPDRCAICLLRERALIPATHSVPDVDPESIAAVVDRLALSATRHLAFDRNLLGIDPARVVRISDRLLREVDGPSFSRIAGISWQADRGAATPGGSPGPGTPAIAL
jgi:hypothetical protein